MSEEHAKVNRLDLLKLALIGANQRIAEAAHQIIDIQREIDSHNHPVGWKGKSADKAEASLGLVPPAGRGGPASRKRKLSPAARKKISDAQKKRWAASRKAAKKEVA